MLSMNQPSHRGVEIRVSLVRRKRTLTDRPAKPLRSTTRWPENVPVYWARVRNGAPSPLASTRA